MENKKDWNELTDYQKELARNNYIAIRACEDEITEEEAFDIYDTSDQRMSEMSGYYIDEENDTVNVNI